MIYFDWFQESKKMKNIFYKYKQTLVLLIDKNVILDKTNYLSNISKETLIIT